MHRRWLAVAAAVCVLLAGCGSAPASETPENPQTTLETADAADSETASVTTEAADATLRVESESDRAVEVTVRVAELGGETYYKTVETLPGSDQLYLDSVVADRTPVEVTVAVANDTATRELFVGQGLTFVVANASSLSIEKIWYSA